MNKFIQIILLCFLVLPSCNQTTSKSMDAVAKLSCQDITDGVFKYATSAVPFGSTISDYIITDDMKNGLLCDCLTPTIRSGLSKVSNQELDEMVTNRIKRDKLVRNIIFQNNKEIISCYEKKGFKGVKIVKKFIQNLSN